MLKKNLLTRVSEEVYNTIELRAKRENRTISNFIRNILVEEIKNGK